MTTQEMPKYKSIKNVWALKIKRVDINHKGNALLLIQDEGFAPVEVDKAYVNRHDPKSGGYYVVYKSGYESFCPAKDFEEGNVRIN